jgi:hypothetical protein
LRTVDAPSPNQGPRRGGAEPDLVVLHHTGMASAAAALERLRDPAAAVSAHYLIGADGTVWQLRGKSGLPEATVPGNARAERSDGKRHREQTAAHARGTVKRWGKSPPRPRQRGWHGKPHREQCRIGTASRGASPQRSGLAARGAPATGVQRNGHPWGATPGTESGLQAIRATLTFLAGARCTAGARRSARSGVTGGSGKRGSGGTPCGPARYVRASRRCRSARTDRPGAPAARRAPAGARAPASPAAAASAASAERLAGLPGTSAPRIAAMAPKRTVRACPPHGGRSPERALRRHRRQRQARLRRSAMRVCQILPLLAPPR